MADTCSSCRYWVPNDEPQGITSDHGWGECRRYPPHVVQAWAAPSSGPGWSSPAKKATVFPITTGELGCGDHKEKGE